MHFQHSIWLLYEVAIYMDIHSIYVATLRSSNLHWSSLQAVWLIAVASQPIALPAVCLSSIYSCADFIVADQLLVSFPCCSFSCVHRPLRYFKDRGIPGPNPTPIIGNLSLVRQSAVSCAHTYVHNHTVHTYYVRARIYMHTHKHAHMLTRIHTYTCSHRLTHTHTHTRTHAVLHVHVMWPSSKRKAEMPAHLCMRT